MFKRFIKFPYDYHGLEWGVKMKVITDIVENAITNSKLFYCILNNAEKINFHLHSTPWQLLVDCKINKEEENDAHCPCNIFKFTLFNILMLLVGKKFS